MKEPEASSRPLYFAVIAMLLFVGVELWFLVMHGLGVRAGQPLIIALAAIVAMVRPLAREVARGIDLVKAPSDRARRIIALLIFLGSIPLLYFDARVQHRDFGLRYQDEFSYQIQTLMEAHGRLWEPAHPLPEFFESFQLIATPVYASVYFPGSAMLFAPGIWLHAPHWLMPLIASAAAIGVIYLVFTELIDGVAGILAAILLAANSIFREQNIMVMSQVPSMLGALALVWTYLRWSKSRGIVWTIGMGAVAGWLIITRPVDALTVIIPVGVAALIQLRRERWPRRGAIVVAGIAGAFPFLVLQGIFNLRVTGHIAESPFEFYTRQVYPLATYGFHGTIPTTAPSWPLPQVREAYRNLCNNLLAEHTPAKALKLWMTSRLPDTIVDTIPHSLLIVLVPVGLLGLRGRRWIVAAMLPLFVALYFPYVFFIRHYAVIVIPAMILLILLGVRVLCDLHSSMRPQMLSFLVIVVAGLCISEWPIVNRHVHDEFMPAAELRQVGAELANLPHRPAIVLFHFSPGASLDEEPVYNVGVLDPDDAGIIRAHDRGADNMKLFDYYAQRQPDRWVYLYDRPSGAITELGQVKALVGSSR